MKRLAAFFLVLFCFVGLKAQEEVVTTITFPEQADPATNRVYAELIGSSASTFGFNKSVTVNVDLGQYQSVFKPYTLLDDNGKAIKFHSMVAAMNYMGERGWKFVQVYVVVNPDKETVYHWLMYKDVATPDQIYEGLRIKNTDTDPKHAKKD